MLRPVWYLRSHGRVMFFLAGMDSTSSVQRRHRRSRRPARVPALANVGPLSLRVQHQEQDKISTRHGPDDAGRLCVSLLCCKGNK